MTQWVPDVHSAPDAETAVVRLARGGTLIIRAADGLLEGLANPFAAWQIIGADGDPVFPGGENHRSNIWDVGGGFLTGDGADGYAVALAPGPYTVTWELHRGPEAEDGDDLICSGEARVEVVAGQVVTLTLDAE